MMVMIVTGLAAAGLYGAAAALEQRQAERVPDESAGKLALLGHLARNPLWLLGFAAQFAGFGVHAVALRSGPLDTVQMLVAAELIVAIVLVQIWSGRKLNPTSSAAALAVVAGITAFLFLTTPGGHAHGQGHGMPRLSLVAAVVLGAAAMALVLAGLRAAGHRRAILLALAAGAGDACSAVVTMAFTHVIGHGLASVMTSWTTYAVIVAGIGNILLTQTAYQAGRPLVTLPLISAFVPVASVAVGVGLLGEAPRVSLASGVGAGVAVLITSVALAVLARSAPAPSSPVQAAKARPGSAHPGSAQLAPALPVPAQLAHTVSARSDRVHDAQARPGHREASHVRGEQHLRPGFDVAAIGDRRREGPRHHPDSLQRYARGVRAGPGRQVRLGGVGQRVHAGRGQALRAYRRRGRPVRSSMSFMGSISPPVAPDWARARREACSTSALAPAGGPTARAK